MIFPTLSPAKYFYKMAASMKFSKQELSCSIGAHYEIIGWENWIVQTPTFPMVHTKKIKIILIIGPKLDRVNRPLNQP